MCFEIDLYFPTGPVFSVTVNADSKKQAIELAIENASEFGFTNPIKKIVCNN